MKTTRLISSRALCVGVLALGFGAVSGLAETTVDRPRNDKPYTNHTTPTSRNSDLKGSDRAFFEKACKLGMTEITLSEVAAERGIHQEVRALAAAMVAAHGPVDADLTALAARKGVDLPKHDETEIRKQKKQWSEKKAKEFDEDYLEEFIDAHKNSVELFEKAVKSDDADIAAFAGQHLGAFKQHLSEAKALKNKID